MLLILISVVIIIMYLKYKTSAKYILDPSMIVLSVFLLSTSVCLANVLNWGDISLLTFYTICLGILSFVIGHSFGIKLNIKGKRTIADAKKKVGYLEISGWKTTLVILFMVIITILDYRDIVELAGGRGTGILGIVAGARLNLYIENEAVKHGVILQQCIYICRVLSYIYIFEIVYSMRIQGNRFKLINTIPIIIYFVQALLSTGRTEFIYLIYAILVINYCLSMSKDKWKKKEDFKYTKQIIWGVIVFFAIFIVLANVRSSSKISIVRTISIYTGSSVKALDLYIRNNGVWNKSLFWGEETQSLFYSVGRALGITAKSSKSVLEAVRIDSSITNIYTALRRYIHDYGIIGMSFIMFSLGIFYSYEFKKIRGSNEQGVNILIYAFLSYPLVEMSIEERFFSNLITARTVFCVAYMVILFNFLIKKSVCMEERN